MSQRGQALARVFTQILSFGLRPEDLRRGVSFPVGVAA